MGEENNFGVPADGGQFDNLDLDDDYTTEDTPSSTPGETGPMASVEKLFTPLNMMVSLFFFLFFFFFFFFRFLDVLTMLPQIMLGILVVVGVIGSIALAVVYEVYMLPVLFVIAVSVPCGLYYAFWLFKDKDQANAAFMGLFCVLGGIGYIVKGIMILVLAIGFVFLVMIAALVIFGLLLNGADQGICGMDDWVALSEPFSRKCWPRGTAIGYCWTRSFGSCPLANRLSCSDLSRHVPCSLG